MNQRIYLILSVATIFIMAIFFWRDREAQIVANQMDSENEIMTSQNQNELKKPSDELIRQQMAESQSIKDKNSLAAETENQATNEEIKKAFSIHLRELSQCFGVTGNPDSDQMDPTYSALTSFLSTSFGDVLVKLDDWTQFDLVGADGQTKRVRTEIEYLENNIPTTRVQLYNLNSQGMPELQELTAEQAALEPEQLISQFRTDANIQSDEKGLRAYFSEGEELVVVEKNNKIQSFSLSKGEKSFSCSDTDSVNSRCQCL